MAGKGGSRPGSGRPKAAVMYGIDDDDAGGTPPPDGPPENNDETTTKQRSLHPGPKGAGAPPTYPATSSQDHREMNSMSKLMIDTAPSPTQADTDRVPVVGSIVIYWFEAYRPGELVGAPGLVSGVKAGSPGTIIDLYFFSDSARLGRRGNTGHAVSVPHCRTPTVCHWSWPESEDVT